MRQISFFLLFFAVSLTSVGQESNRLFIRNDDLVRSIAKDISPASSNDIPVESIRAAFKEAFDEYWNKKSNQCFTSSEMMKYMEQLKKLEKDTLLKSIEHVRLKKSIDSLKTAITQTGMSEAEQQATNESKALEFSIDSLVRIIPETRNNVQSLVEQISELEKQIAEIRGSLTDYGSLIGEFKNVADDLPKQIMQTAVLCRGSLLYLDLKKVAAVSAEFAQNGEMLKSIEPALYHKCCDSLSVINNTVKIAEIMQKSVIQMGMKFDNQRNMELASELKKAMNSSGRISHNKECMSIYSALLNQNNAYKNITYILKYVKESGQSPNFKIKDAIDLVGIVSPGKSRYCEYYSRFNDVLDELECGDYDVKTLGSEL